MEKGMCSEPSWLSEYQRQIESTFPEEEVVYLDHAAATIASPAQLERVFTELNQPPFRLPCNPHSSGSLLSSAMDERIQAARQEVLAHFGASSDDYTVVFTSGATAAIKLVADTINLGWLGYTENSHTSLLGLREFAEKSFLIPSQAFQYHGGDCQRDGEQGGEQGGEKEVAQEEDRFPTQPLFLNLLAYPGECNFNGMKLDSSRVATLLENLNATSDTHTAESLLFANGASDIDSVQDKQGREEQDMKYPNSTRRWVSLLDASKLASSTHIDLSSWPRRSRPHFLVCSFYKIFGYPTGIGALLVRRSLLPSMTSNKRFFGGGTVAALAVEARLLKPEVSLEKSHLAMEDGTLNYHGILAIRHGFQSLQKFGGMYQISKYLSILTVHALKSLRLLKHSNGRKLCEIYEVPNSDNGFSSSGHPELAIQGPVVAFNVIDSDGAPVGFETIGRSCAKALFQVRTGCFCNIGSCQRELKMSALEVLNNLEAGRSCHSGEGDIIDGRNTGAVRISFGYMTRKSEIDKFVEFLVREFVDFVSPMPMKVETPVPIKSAPEMSIGTGEWNREEYRLEEVYLYPIKSCGAQQVRSWPLGPEGLLFDRAWMLVDEQGAAITQKKCPMMVRVLPEIDLDAGCISFRSDLSSSSLTINLSAIHQNGKCGASSSNSISISDGDLQMAGHRMESKEPLMVRVCGRRTVVDTLANAEAEKADSWFSHVLNRPCRLVAASMARKRQPESSSSSFKNDQPFLVVTRQSIDRLSDVMGRTISSRVFRPNFVISRIKPSEQDAESLGLRCKRLVLQVSGSEKNYTVPLISQGPCQRCSMVNVDPSSGEVGQGESGVLRTLRSSSSLIVGVNGNVDHRALLDKSTSSTHAGSVYFGEFFAFEASDAEDQENISFWDHGRFGFYVQEFSQVHVECST